MGDKYTYLLNKKSDINEHLPILKKYGEKCDIIVEMGVRAVVSTFALLAAKPKKLISLDLYHPNKWDSENELNEAVDYAKKNKIQFSFVLGNTLEYKIDKCDLLFIDTLHQYNQLKQELKLHSPNVSKYIIMHDTSKFEFTDEVTGADGGLWPAIEEFLLHNKNWCIKERYINNNGLTILEHI